MKADDELNIKEVCWAPAGGQVPGQIYSQEKIADDEILLSKFILYIISIFS